MRIRLCQTEMKNKTMRASTRQTCYGILECECMRVCVCMRVRERANNLKIVAPKNRVDCFTMDFGRNVSWENPHYTRTHHTRSQWRTMYSVHTHIRARNTAVSAYMLPMQIYWQSVRRCRTHKEQRIDIVETRSQMKNVFGFVQIARSKSILFISFSTSQFVVMQKKKTWLNDQHTRRLNNDNLYFMPHKLQLTSKIHSQITFRIEYRNTGNDESNYRHQIYFRWFHFFNSRIPRWNRKQNAPHGKFVNTRRNGKGQWCCVVCVSRPATDFQLTITFVLNKCSTCVDLNGKINR